MAHNEFCKIRIWEFFKKFFNETDKHNDLIIKRTDFVAAAKANKTVKKLLDEEAIKIDRRTKLTLEEVLRDFEKDQNYRDDSDLNESTNYKEFFSWDEFVDFVENYQLPEVRHNQQVEVTSKQGFTAKLGRGKYISVKYFDNFKF